MVDLPIEVWDKIFKMKRRMEFKDLIKKMDKKLVLYGPMKLNGMHYYSKRIVFDDSRFHTLFFCYIHLVGGQYTRWFGHNSDNNFLY